MGVAALVGLLVAGAGVSGYAVYKTSVPSPDAATYTPSAPKIAKFPDQPRMAIVGDSFASTAPDDWGPRTARCAGYRSVISGVRSSGFYNPGISVKYGDPIRMNAVTKDKPEVVIFETAYNDARRAETNPEWIEKSAIDTIEAYRKVVPKAKFVIFGPFPTDRFDGPNVTNNIAALRAAAAATGALHIVPTLAWQPTIAHTDADLAHPSDKGHRFLAGKLLVALRDAGVITSTGGCENLT
jgi:hypothetical protein